MTALALVAWNFVDASTGGKRPRFAIQLSGKSLLESRPRIVESLSRLVGRRAPEGLKFFTDASTLEKCRSIDSIVSSSTVEAVESLCRNECDVDSSRQLTYRIGYALRAYPKAFGRKTRNERGVLLSAAGGAVRYVA